jgi:hypothetical protein
MEEKKKVDEEETDYEKSAYARPRTKGTFKEFNELDDRVEDYG